MTFTREDGEDTQGVGYYGTEKNMPVYRVYNLDPQFSRGDGQFGTDIYILGFKYSGNLWKKTIIPYVLSSFLGAIWRGQLEMEIDDELISKATLPGIVDKYKDEIDDDTLSYYHVLTSEKTNSIHITYFEKGDIELKIIVGESDLPRKIAMVRKNGMKIFDKDRIKGFVPFSGVLFINGIKANSFLRSLENPEHTKWEKDRHDNPKEAKSELDRLNGLITKEINKLVEDFTGDESDVAGMGTYLPDDTPDNQKSRIEVIDDKTESLELKSNDKTSIGNSDNPPPDYIGTGDANVDGLGGNLGTGEEGYINGDDTSGDGPKPTADVGPSPGPEVGESKCRKIGIERVTSICIDNSKGRYMIFITPSSDIENGFLKIYLSGETRKYDVKILKAYENGRLLTLNNNCIGGLSLKQGVKTKIAIEIDYTRLCSLEVEIYANTK